MTLVFGGNGQLGTTFRRLLPDGVFVTRADADLTRTGEIVRLLSKLRPTAIINCAAYTAVDRAEENEDTATAVNATAVAAIAEYAAIHSVPLVTYSTDYVFDGRAKRPYLENDSPNPINAYGRSKLKGEQEALRAYPDTLVIRTSWLLSGTHANFVSAILKKARSGHVSVVNDQTGCPTFVDDLAQATLEALSEGVTGVLHVANSGTATWYDLARYSVEIAGMDSQIVEPCRTDDLNLAAQRPQFSALSTKRTAEMGLSRLPEWQEPLPDVVQQILSWI